MRLLADESCDFAVVRALREAGYDVMAITETASGSTDDEVADLAAREDRILITEDRDFGRLVHAGSARIPVVYVRFPANARSGVGSAVVSAVTSLGNRFGRRFVVVQPGRVRIVD